MKKTDFDGSENFVTFDKQTGKGSNILQKKDRVWMVIIMNPQKHEITIDKIREILKNESDNLTYWAAINEVSVETNTETGQKTPHIHIVLYYSGQIHGSHILKLFPHASLQNCKASTESCVKYIRKDTSGKWYENHPEKLAEKLPPEQAQFTEWGDMPGKKNAGGEKLSAKAIVHLIDEGSPDAELLALDPTLYNKLQHIRQTRTTILSERFAHTFRNLDVTYIEGATGTGKTRYVMESTDYAAYRINDYDHPWDGYEQQDIVVFDEFRSQLELSDMLQWLDGYPCKLRARYVNSVACYTKVYIISNWPLESQYTCANAIDTAAWQRRIHHKRIYTDIGVYTDYDYNPTTKTWEIRKETALC